MTGRFGYGFKLGLMKKDCGIAAGILKQGFPHAPLLPRACEAVAAATDAQGADADYTELAKWLESMAGRDIRVKPAAKL